MTASDDQERLAASATVFLDLNDWFDRQYTAPRVLGHYTSIANAVSIIEKGEVWLSNVMTMNDEHEIDHALDFIVAQCKSRSLKHILPAVQRFLDWRKRLQPSVYVFCLSAPRGRSRLDQLSMWRAYGDDGNGVALQFRSDALVNGNNDDLRRPMLAKVLYKKSDKSSLVRGLIAEFESRCEEYGFSVGDLSDALDSMLWKIAPVLKHSAFAEEEEWRLVVEVDALPHRTLEQAKATPIKFTASQRPYVPLQLGLAQGEGVFGALVHTTFAGALVGPSNNARAHSAIIGAALMRRQGATQVDLSAIPYRGRPAP